MDSVSSGYDVKDEPKKAEKKPQAKRLEVLKNPERVELIKGHRMMHSKYGNVFTKQASSEGKPVFGDQVPKHMEQLQLCDIDTDMDCVFLNKVFTLTIIENPMLGLVTPIYLICEDINGDACRVSINKIPKNDAMKDLLSIGRQLAIKNPYWRVNPDGIHVDDPSTVAILGKIDNQCHYCCKENAPLKCSRCKVAPYCGRDCQMADWSELNHKKVCQKSK